MCGATANSLLLRGGDNGVVPSESALVDGHPIAFDGLELIVRLSPRRTRLGLTLERDGSILLRVPPGCGLDRAEAFVRGNRPWIESKSRLREDRAPAQAVRDLSEGEIHRYLGREYRLHLVDESDAPTRLTGGRLQLSRAVAADPVLARAALAAWYCQAGRRWATNRVQPWAARMEVPELPIEVRDVGRRWGTYRSAPSGPGRIALHWAAFQLPTRLVDYVIAHELAHVRIAGHGTAYWRLLAQALPECVSLKQELDEMGRRVWLGDLATR
ncbi:M48 family metallopeptidase [Streptacidiphilus sp. P02-A3a]|nr:M48 family metallopeptidase [Streptacidiphilus sp. P02-A3a]